MSNTAEILNFPAVVSGIQEQRVADTDDGYTRLANELYEELIGANLTKNQAKVAHAVCRKTYGFNKKMDRIADSQLSELTRLPRQKVNAAKNELIAMNVLVSDGMLIGPNKNLSEWVIPGTKPAPKCHHSSDCHHGSDSVPTVVTKSVTKTVTTLSPKWGHTKDTITKDNKDNINKPPKSPKGENSLAQEVMNYFNELTGSRCAALAPFEKALSTVKSKDQCYTAEELKLVIRWAHVNWGHSFKPENLCRMTRFDGYLSDALIWADGQGSNPAACPHEEIIKLWNEKFPSKAVSLHEWSRRRPAYRDLEAVWNGKTTQGNWRELKHMGMAFELISKSSLFGTRGDQPWLTLDWILNPKNWGSVYEQAINEHRERKGVKA